MLSRILAAALGLAAIVATVFLLTAATERAVAKEKNLEQYVKQQAAELARAFDNVPKAQVEAWKKQYAFQSVRGRLAYEKSVDLSPPKLGDAATARLQQLDKNIRLINTNRRALSLANYELYPPIDAARVNTADYEEVMKADKDKRWKIARLELVSLLKHDVPQVYLSENLPRMEDLSSAKTRELSPFEAGALKKLVAGEDLEMSPTPNRIEMLGSLRASTQCMQCHEVPHGTLLGAFSYELRRDPPLKVEAAKVAPIQ